MADHGTEQFIFKHLRNAADSAEMAVDLSGSPSLGPFFYEVPVGKWARIERLNIWIRDAGVQPSTFGGISALSGGVTVEVLDENGAQAIDFTDGLPITNNRQFGLLAGTDASLDSGVGDDAVNVRWTISRAGASLRLSSGERFQITCSDDLSSLTTMRAMIQGTLYDE